MNSEVLSPTDRGKWRELLSSVGNFDVYYTLNHLHVIGERCETPRLFRYGTEEDFVVYPFLKRKINDLPFVDEGDLDATYYDLITSEYAGPLCRCEHVSVDRLLAEFREAFERYSRDNNVVCEFGRLHPFINSEEPFIEALDATYRKDIVYVDLSKDEERIRAEMRKSKRRQLEKSTDALSVEVSEDWQVFKDMYHATMARAGAEERYWYDEAFFERIFSELDDQSLLLIAYKGDQPVSGLIALTGERFIHSYLSGSYQEYLDLYGNVLLKYETIRRGMESGRDVCNFGGGVDGSDGVYKFKKEFSETTAPFYTYQDVFDEETYDLINQLKKIEVGSDVFDKISFFPRYRGPA